MGGFLCEHCVGYCCKYIALPIETPTERRDFDDIRWYLLHEGVAVFVEDGEWFINVQTTCRHLQPDYRCGIYETRPKICRDYSTDNCDYHSGDYGWEHHFTCPEHLDEYIQVHFLPGKRKKKAGGVKGGKARRKRTRPRLKAKLAPMRQRKTKAELAYASATADIRGVPLPVLPPRANGDADTG